MATSRSTPARTMVLTPPLGTSTAVPDDWSDASARRCPTANGSLLEAFCEGAGLDASLLSSEEPAEIMRRAGAVYRQMVLGIGDLMAERDRARGQYKLSRTTIGGANNNPFKWAPTQRLAIDLLLAGSGSFLSGPAALQASFRDIKRHLIATFAGLHGSLRAAIDSVRSARRSTPRSNRARRCSRAAPRSRPRKSPTATPTWRGNSTRAKAGRSNARSSPPMTPPRRRPIRVTGV